MCKTMKNQDNSHPTTRRPELIKGKTDRTLLQSTKKNLMSYSAVNKKITSFIFC